MYHKLSLLLQWQALHHEPQQWQFLLYEWCNVFGMKHRASTIRVPFFKLRLKLNSSLCYNIVFAHYTLAQGSFFICIYPHRVLQQLLINWIRILVYNKTFTEYFATSNSDSSSISSRFFTVWTAWATWIMLESEGSETFRRVNVNLDVPFCRSFAVFCRSCLLASP